MKKTQFSNICLNFHYIKPTVAGPQAYYLSA